MQTLFTRLISVGAFSLFASQALAAPINATLHKDPNCGCCVEDANYLEDNGFNVKMIDHANMTPVKQRLGTAQAASCHTVEIEGYVVEGHVPDRGRLFFDARLSARHCVSRRRSTFTVRYVRLGAAHHLWCVADVQASCRGKSVRRRVDLNA